jgi:hypothetical protein
MWPNSWIAVVNIWLRLGQWVTSVFWNKARGRGRPSFCALVEEYCEMRVWASGRRVRSAMRTEQFRERRRAAKERFMPVFLGD